MTLKKCTVTQLDDVFWRVDCPAPLAPFVVHLTCVDGCARASTFNGRSFWGGTWWQALDALLEENGLTRHDTPETAEARVRAAVDMSEPPLQADLRAILAELDRVREALSLAYNGSAESIRRESEAAAELKRVLDELEDEKSQRIEFSGALFKAGAELDRLRAQRPVDVEAVLAPVRMLREDFAQRGVYAKECATTASYARRNEDAERAHGRRHAYEDAAFELRRAIAEAEKIARGQ